MPLVGKGLLWPRLLFGCPARKAILARMLARITSAATLGVDAFLVDVEVDLSNGLPCMNVVGLPDGAVRESRERVTAAIQNTGLEIPPRKVTINLAPADVKKDGSAFDLPISIGLLAANSVLQAPEATCIIGELGLDGDVRPVRGVLAIALRCARAGIRRLIVPQHNAREAAVVSDLEVCAVKTLAQLIAVLRGEARAEVVELNERDIWGAETPAFDLDYADVKGQESARRAIEVAAAGQHNLLLIGPPGAGKSMLARRIPSILPPLDLRESLEVTKVHSVAGRLRPGQALLRARPFRAPHHTISDAGLVGGGSTPRPGEVSLAHHGVLFLDEFPEFRRHVLDALRQPLEDGVVIVGRARMSITFPARFMLAAAMNPCLCGFHGTGAGACTCTSRAIERYMARISGPLHDRIDVQIHVPALQSHELTGSAIGESSAAIRDRVLLARARQRERFKDRDGVFANAHMTAADVRQFCSVDARGEELLRGAIQKLGLSARAYHRVLRMARTIADLASRDIIAPTHVAEAIQYRCLDRQPKQRRLSQW